MGTLFVDKLDPQSGTSLEIGSSGDTMTVPSGATFNVAGTLQSGGAALGNAPYFEAKMSATQDPADNAWTKLNYNTEVFDSASAYDTSNYRFTPQTAGKYFCYLHVVFDAQGVDKFHSAQASIYKNGSSYKKSYYDNYDNYYGYAATGNVSAVIDFNGSSDYIEPYGIFNVTTGTGRINNDISSIFGGYKLIT